MPSSLILASIDAFAILWTAVVWMFAGIIAGVLVAIPIFFITLSLSTNQDSDPQDAASRVALFVVSAIALVGLLIGASQEYGKQEQMNRSSYLPEKTIQQSYLINPAIPSKSFR